jgi:ABC-type transport system involved in cytochrome bd biosynthesis fused ATPase/permease subunit
VVEHGTHRELLAENSVYANLVQTQLAGSDVVELAVPHCGDSDR